MAPTGIFFGSSASLQVELRVSPRCPCVGVSVARAAEVPQVGGALGGGAAAFPLLCTVFGRFTEGFFFVRQCSESRIPLVYTTKAADVLRTAKYRRSRVFGGVFRTTSHATRNFFI